MSETTELDEYREQVRTWLEGNLEKRSGGMRGLRGADHKTIEGIAAERTIQKKIFDAGYAGITWPKEYGGQGLSNGHQMVWTQESMAYRTPDFGVAGGTTMGVCSQTMLRHASPEFLSVHIPKILSGDHLWVQFFSEPGAGSDLAGVTTRAERDGERWILNGSKIWSSGAYYADYGMCIARTDWDVPKHRGLTWFAVKIHQPGVEVVPIREINGDAEFCQEFFTDVELSDDDMIGELNQGWTVAQTMLVFERGGGGGGGGGMAAAMAGRRPARRQLAPDLVTTAKRLQREADPHVRQLIARAHTNDFAMGALMGRIGGLMRQNAGADAGVAAYGKLAQGSFGALRARIHMEVGRGGALTWEPGNLDEQTPSLNYLNGRLMSIAGGTNEVQRNGIGERVLGLPREPSFDSDKPFNEVIRNAKNWSGKV
jgi:alkylation response protein AidB-like acyl-CoA dehydrogenase